MPIDIAVGIILLFVVVYIYRYKALPPLPPGPVPLPIIGNQRQLPKQQNWKTYSEWSKKYAGDIIHLTNWGRHIIILNSFQAAYDLLDRKSTIYSSRPQSIMLHQLMNFNAATPFLPYGNTWRKHRTLYTKQMHIGAMEQFKPLQKRAIGRLLVSLLESPDQFVKHFRHMAAMIVMDYAYGYDIKPMNDKYVRMAENNTKSFGLAISPRAYLVDNIPWLRYVPKWMPGAGFKRTAEAAKKNIEGIREKLFRQVQKQLETGTARPSFVANSLSALGTETPSAEDINAIKMVASSSLHLFSFQTAATIHVFSLAMVLYPDVLRKAQQELDSVVGKERLPEPSDRPA
ncbi:hypothetical protein M422DRAFT_179536, partial [Sphaerobolus stellatus SS14]